MKNVALYCPECGEKRPDDVGNYDYCEHCGAAMNDEQETQKVKRKRNKKVVANNQKEKGRGLTIIPIFLLILIFIVGGVLGFIMQKYWITPSIIGNWGTRPMSGNQKSAVFDSDGSFQISDPAINLTLQGTYTLGDERTYISTSDFTAMQSLKLECDNGEVYETGCYLFEKVDCTVLLIPLYLSEINNGQYYMFAVYKKHY